MIYWSSLILSVCMLQILKIGRLFRRINKCFKKTFWWKRHWNTRFWTYLFTRSTSCTKSDSKDWSVIDSNPIDWEEVNAILEKYRRIGDDFLHNKCFKKTFWWKRHWNTRFWTYLFTRSTSCTKFGYVVCMLQILKIGRLLILILLIGKKLMLF